MNDNAQYWLNSAGWLLVGLIIASIYWRCYVHRILVLQGRVKKEQPLALFMALLVGMTSIAGLLFAQSSRLALESYIHCQAQVNQQFRQGYADRVDAAAQDRAAVDDVIAAILQAHSPTDVLAALHAYEQARAENDAARAKHPVVVNGNCTPPKSAEGAS